MATPEAGQAEGSVTGSRPAPFSFCRRLLLGAVVAFGFVLLTVVIYRLSTHGPLRSLDGSVANWLVRFHHPSLREAVLVATYLGNWKVLLLVLAATVLIFHEERRFSRGLALVISIAGAGGLAELLKVLIARPRPRAALYHVAGYGFPSGHAMLAVSFYGMGVWLVLCSGWRRRWKALSCAGLVLIMLLVGASRVYLRAHWLSDVLGGYAAAGAWLAVCVTALSVTARVGDKGVPE